MKALKDKNAKKKRRSILVSSYYCKFLFLNYYLLERAKNRANKQSFIYMIQKRMLLKR